MNSKSDILSELFSLSELVGNIPKTNVFQVPEGYFETVSEEVTEKIATLHFSLISNTQSVPQGYFESLPTILLEKIRLQESNEIDEELNDLSPVLSAITKQNLFTVPNTYFDENLVNLPTLISNSSGKVIAMSQRKNLLKYAVAAVAAGLIGFMVFLGLPTAQNKTDFTITQSVMQDAKNILKENNFDSVLDNIKPEEIEKYFVANGENPRTVLLASVAGDDNNLPSAEDYIFNENTLDDYLKNIEIEN